MQLRRAIVIMTPSRNDRDKIIHKLYADLNNYHASRFANFGSFPVFAKDTERHVKVKSKHKTYEVNYVALHY